MTHTQRAPLSAVCMIAAHIFLDLCKQNNMDRRQLSYTIPGHNKATYRDMYAEAAAQDAWTIARAVEDAAPEVSPDSKKQEPCKQ
jgi:hypothetical protein